MEKKQETSYNYTDQYAAVMESRLKSMLESVEGAGEVKVMITLKTTANRWWKKTGLIRRIKLGRGNRVVRQQRIII